MYFFWIFLPILATAVQVVDWRFLPIDQFNQTDEKISEALLPSHNERYRNLMDWGYTFSGLTISDDTSWNFLVLMGQIVFKRIQEMTSTELKTMRGIDAPDMAYFPEKCTNGTLFVLNSTTRLDPPYVMMMWEKITFLGYLDIGDIQIKYPNCYVSSLSGTITSNRVYWQISYKRVHNNCIVVMDKCKLRSGNITWGTFGDDLFMYGLNDVNRLSSELRKYLTQTLVPQYLLILENRIKTRVAKFVMYWRPGAGKSELLCSKIFH